MPRQMVNSTVLYSVLPFSSQNPAGSISILLSSLWIRAKTVDRAGGPEESEQEPG